MLLDNLYKLQSKEENIAIVILSDENHPVFQAHFPGQPILPGFVHFDIIEDVFDIEITTIKRAKYLKVAHPKQSLIYERNNNKFKVSSDGEDIATFTL
jgi:3-hydroxyacyl-[acyl-carrier-protein] dehydratase